MTQIWSQPGLQGETKQPKRTNLKPNSSYGHVYIYLPGKLYTMHLQFVYKKKTVQGLDAQCPPKIHAQLGTIPGGKNSRARLGNVPTESSAASCSWVLRFYLSTSPQNVAHGARQPETYTSETVTRSSGVFQHSKNLINNSK